MIIAAFFLGAFTGFAIETLKKDHPVAAPLVCGALGGCGLALLLLLGAP